MPFLGLRVELFVELELVNADELESVHAYFSVRSTLVVSADELAQNEMRRDPQRSLWVCAQRSELHGGGARRRVLHVRLSIGHRVGAYAFLERERVVWGGDQIDSLVVSGLDLMLRGTGFESGG